MTGPKRYASGMALRTALEERLNKEAVENNTDLQRLRRKVAFDRLLARLFRNRDTNWVLKGGYAMELRFDTARATRDIDFTVRRAPAPGAHGLHRQLQDAGAEDIGDFFSYRIGDVDRVADFGPDPRSSSDSGHL